MNTQRKTTEASLARTLGDDEGFATHAVTADLARRQLHVSLAVMGIMVAATLAIAAAVGLSGRPDAGPAIASVTVQQPEFVRPMTAQATRLAIQPGG